MSTIVPYEMRKNVRWKKSNGSYSPDDNGNIYAPKSAHDNNIARLDLERVQEMSIKRLCGACMESVENQEIAFLVPEDEADCTIISEPPMHLDCALYAALACPHVRQKGFSAIVTRYWDTWDTKPTAKHIRSGETVQFSIDSKQEHHILNYDDFIGLRSQVNE